MVANEVEQIPSPFPSYFSREFFEKCLDIGKVTDFSARQALGKGENYTSVIYKVEIQIQGEARPRSFIVKCAPEEGRMREVLEELEIYNKETLALRKLVPEASELLREAGLGTKLCAKLHYYRSEDSSCVILEDLTETGHRLADRKKGLDLRHCKLVLSKVARLHAAGKIIYDKDNSELKLFSHSHYSGQSSDTMVTFFGKSMDALIEMLKDWGPEFKTIGDKLNKKKSTFMETAQRIDREDCPFKVFNHGDLWVNNMMFRYNEEQQVQDVVLVDYQCTSYGSPAGDLNYFIDGSTNEEVFWNSRDELIQYYHGVLTSTLKALGYTGYVPTLEKLRQEIDFCSALSLVSFFCVKPIMLNESGEDTGDIMEEIDGSETGFMNLKKKLANPNMVRILKPRIKYYDQQGILD